ncbi:MAG: hypothetical protein O3B01_28075, partial [Planctomycetota bacterium]|nr:hypothetical protein [Planctomycetota bacterium]
SPDLHGPATGRASNTPVKKVYVYPFKLKVAQADDSANSQTDDTDGGTAPVLYIREGKDIRLSLVGTVPGPEQERTKYEVVRQGTPAWTSGVDDMMPDAGGNIDVSLTTTDTLRTFDVYVWKDNDTGNDRDTGEQERHIVVYVVGLDFLMNDNTAFDPDTEALNVSNYVTTDGLPTKANTAYATTCNDPDNFRIEVNNPAETGNSVDVKIKVNTGADVTYTLDMKTGARFRGPFLRLVTDGPDNSASEHGANSDPDNQTILVAPGDTVTVTYTPTTGLNMTQQLQVGRPSTENNNGANQLQHDIRILKVRFVVFKNQTGTAPAATRPQVEADIQTLRQRYGQANISVNILKIDIGGQGDPGIALPAAMQDGYTRGNIPRAALNDDEQAIIAFKDNDADSIDFLYVDELKSPAGNNVRATAYRKGSNQTGNPEGQSFVVMGPTRGVLSVAHEPIHIMLDSSHRGADEPNTALFHPTTTNAVNGTKRMGPYPDAANANVGNADTTNLRASAESLPQ